MNVPRRAHDHVPIGALWVSTSACNLHCRHCWVSADRKLPNELTGGHVRRLMEELRDMGVGLFGFAGGEPLLRTDVYENAERAAELGFFVGISTNGTLIDDAVAARLRDAGVCMLGISLDGATPRVHDRFREHPGAFDMSVRGIRAGVEAGLAVSVRMTVGDINSREAPGIVRLAYELGADEFTLLQSFPQGRALENRLHEERTRTHFIDAVNELLELRGEIDFKCTTRLMNRHFVAVFQRGMERDDSMYAPFMEASRDYGEGCPAGTYLTIMPDGAVRTCIQIQREIGNVHESSLERTWYASGFVGRLRSRSGLKGRCGSCRYRMQCGGCRARAHFYTGDYFETDPGCPLVLDLEGPVP